MIIKKCYFNINGVKRLYRSLMSHKWVWFGEMGRGLAKVGVVWAWFRVSQKLILGSWQLRSIWHTAHGELLFHIRVKFRTKFCLDHAVVANCTKKLSEVNHGMASFPTRGRTLDYFL